jgi:hyperosmotically inducible protein
MHFELICQAIAISDNKLAPKNQPRSQWHSACTPQLSSLKLAISCIQLGNRTKESMIQKLKEVEVNMNRTNLRTIPIAVLAIAIFAPAILGGALVNTPVQGAPSARLIKQVRHELATLPYYGVFDWLEFEVRPDNTVVLRGQVVKPSTKSDAEARVKDVDGVSKVNNEIEVLPLSPQDDRLRTALYRRLYGYDSPLFRYATQAIPSIHIIVDHGHAKLKGIVATKGDAQLAYLRARGVSGLFDVKNELQIESEMPG